MSQLNQKILYIIFQVLFAVAFLSLSGEFRHTEFTVVLSFLPIGVLCIYCSASAWAQDGYSVRLIFWFFTYWFSFLVPLASYLTGKWWYGDMSIVNQNLITYANICILAFTVIYLGSYLVASRFPALPTFWKRYLAGCTIRPTWGLNSSIVVISLTALLYILLGNNLFVRAIDVETETGALERPLYLLLLFIVRPVVLFSIIHVLCKWVCEEDRAWIVLSISSLCLLITNFPSALARYYLFGLIFGLSAVCFIKNGATKVTSFGILWGGTFIAYLLHPLRYLGKQYTSYADLRDAYRNMDLSQYFFDGHYAAYEIFVMGLQYIEEKGLTWGQQLLGTLASWVPRSMWFAKPDHTGKLILDNAISRVSNSQFENISAPVYLESMVDFGWIGLIAFALILGYVSARFDVLFKEIREDLRRGLGKRARVLSLIYSAMAPMPAFGLLFWRGSWMPAFGYLAGASISGIFYIGLVMRRGARGPS